VKRCALCDGKLGFGGRCHNVWNGSSRLLARRQRTACAKRVGLVPIFLRAHSATFSTSSPFPVVKFFDRPGIVLYTRWMTNCYNGLKLGTPTAQF
jgi:hypothetical protein